MARARRPSRAPDRLPTKSSEIVVAVRRRFANLQGDAGHQYAVFEELRVGTGYGRGVEQRIDLWAMGLWASDGYARHAFEVKVTRSDFLAEMKDPLKRRPALLYSNLFYFAAPAGLIKPEELPPEAGLMEVGDWGRGFSAVIIVDAPWFDPPPPSWRFFAAIARRVCRAEAEGRPEYGGCKPQEPSA